ncbi:MAG: Inner membrane protein YohD [Syntrophorhabdus sp. PtaU1.Bin058]|nr:MAG: Inner membrane protein YohD [Syntrophorhabdus sp. PtaU1.Bin058]
METYIAQYGYIGISIGTFLEGETTVLIGGIFAKLGYMHLCMVMLYAFIGTFVGDFTFFTLGKYFGKNFIERYEFIRNKVPLANKVIHKYGNFIIFLIRFLVGIRAVILILLGCTNMKMGKFVLFNIVNSMGWSIIVSIIGYLFGKVIFVFVGDIKQYERIIVPAVLALVVALILIYRYIVKRKEEAYGDE